MSELAPALGQIAVLVVALAVAVPFLGRYLAHVYTSPRHLAVERATYRVLRVDPDADQHWRTLRAVRARASRWSASSLLFGFGRLQQHLPLSLGFPALPADGAWNTAVSFVTNTNWQWYSGEAALGHLMQMSGLTVQNFVSAAVGMAVAAAFARGLARSQRRPAGSATSGPTWCAASSGCCCRSRSSPRSSWSSSARSRTSSANEPMTTLTGGTQELTGGPVASQEAIKELGTNGGGFFNVNSAHPFENPTPFTNIFEIFLILLIPFAMAWAFGLIVRDRRQGVADPRP